MRGAVVACFAVFLSGVGARAFAQSTVSGVVTLEERQGAAHRDVRSAVVFLEARGAQLRNASFSAPPRADIEMRGREFLPHVRIVPAGGSVAFPNDDPFSHNVFSNEDPGAFDLGLYRSGMTRVAAFPRAGIYPIYCNIHSKMVSFVVAVPTPWAAQPDAAGRFVLHNVAPGTYVLHAWHERGAAEVRREIVVPASGDVTADVTIDARTYVDGPHLNKFGRPYMVLRADRY